MEETKEQAIKRHERWLAEHEAIMPKYEEGRLELLDEMKLTWASIRANAELLRHVAHEGNERLRNLDDRLKRLVDLMIGHYGGNGERE